MKLGRLHADGNVLTKDGQVNVTKVKGGRGKGGNLGRDEASYDGS